MCRAGIAHPEREGADHRRVGTAGVAGVDDDVHIALAIQHDFARAVARHRVEADRLEHLAEGLGLGSGVFDELDAFQSERIGDFADRLA